MSTQAKDQSIEGVAKDFSLSLGQDGVVYVTSATQTNGSFRAIQAVADTVFAALVARDWTGTTAGLRLPAGTTIFGDFTSFTLTSGKVVAFGSADPAGGCADADARVWIYGVNGAWSSGPRTLTRVADRHYTFGDEVIIHNGTAWEYYYERIDTGKVSIEIVTGNQPWPWLVPWVDFTAQKLCLPPVYPAYRGGDTIYTIGDRVSHNGGNFVCIYNAGSVGYGPFGGYLDGTANGIIYWLPE